MKFCDACGAGCQNEHVQCWRCGKWFQDLEKCPDCKIGKLVNEEGCAKCHVCGYSLCGV